MRVDGYWLIYHSSRTTTATTATETTMTTFTAPQISINGTSKQELLEQQLAVRAACRALTQALAAAYPNGRDYQYDASHHKVAMVEHHAMQEMVAKVFDRADAMAEHISWEV